MRNSSRFPRLIKGTRRRHTLSPRREKSHFHATPVEERERVLFYLANLIDSREMNTGLDNTDSGTLVLRMLSSFTGTGNLGHPCQRPINARGVHAEMSRNLSASQAKLVPTPTRDGHSGLTHFATLVSPCQLFRADLALLAFLSDKPIEWE